MIENLFFGFWYVFGQYFYPLIGYLLAGVIVISWIYVMLKR